MQQPHHPAVHHHIPLTHAQALEILRKNRQMWANNPGLSKNHIGLEQVLLNAEIAIDAEFDFPQDGAQRDENVRKRLKQAERDLEAHVGILLTWESLHAHATELFNDLPNATPEFKKNGMVRVNEDAASVRKETDLSKLRAALARRQHVVQLLETTWREQHAKYGTNLAPTSSSGYSVNTPMQGAPPVFLGGPSTPQHGHEPLDLYRHEQHSEQQFLQRHATFPPTAFAGYDAPHIQPLHPQQQQGLSHSHFDFLPYSGMPPPAVPSLHIQYQNMQHQEEYPPAPHLLPSQPNKQPKDSNHRLFSTSKRGRMGEQHQAWVTSRQAARYQL